MAALTLNDIFYERYIKNNFYLNVLSYDNESLYLVENDQIKRRVYFVSANDLADLNVNCYNLKDANYFLDILEVNNNCKKEIKEIENDLDTGDNIISELDHRYLTYVFALNKPTSTLDDDQTIIDFIIKYNKLANINDYLGDEAKIVYEQMNKIIGWASRLNNQGNNAISIIKEYVTNYENHTNNVFIDSLQQNNSSGMGKDSTLARTSSKHPSIISDNLGLEKAGFFSFMGLLLIAFNLLVTLVILAIKK